MVKRTKRSVYSLSFLLMWVVSLVMSASVASAASAYDDVIDSVNTVHLSRDGVTQGTPACASVDITTAWASILTNSSSWTARTQIIGGATRTATLADWATTVGNGVGWAVIQQHQNNASTPNDGSPVGDAVFVVFTPSASAQVDFSSTAIYYGAQKQAYMTNTNGGYVYSVRIQVDDLGSSGGVDQCTPVISMALRETTATSWFKELYSVAATSTESSGGYGLRPLFINAPVNYPSGYEGEVASTAPLAPKYAPLGDSYSTGEGNPQFEYGTDVGGVNGCHRSPQSYPRLLQAEMGFEPVAFVACSGATTANIAMSGQWNEPPQIDALTDEVGDVTLTIGGNDVGFFDYVLGCIVACGPGTPIYNAMMTSINSPAFKANLMYAYEEILDAAPNADLYVADYPYLAAEDATTCEGLDFSGAHDVQEALNEVIFDAVMEVGLNSSRIFMVQTNYVGSPFEGGHLCNGGSSLFHGVVLDPANYEYSLHPNAAGHAAYAAVFEDAMSL